MGKMLSREDIEIKLNILFFIWFKYYISMSDENLLQFSILYTVLDFWESLI